MLPDNSYGTINKVVFEKLLLKSKIDINDFMDNVLDNNCLLEENCFCPQLYHNIPSELMRICYEKLQKYLETINKKEFIETYLDYISGISISNKKFKS